MTRLALAGGLACFKSGAPEISSKSRDPRAAGPQMPAELPRNARLFNVLFPVIRELRFLPFILVIPFMQMGRKPQAKKKSYDKSQGGSRFAEDEITKVYEDHHDGHGCDSTNNLS
ncbi:MAG: hypothetical protein P8Q54_14655 [Akkermansiaceae bacterium]|nr:hypothetical protein [Akkermansiaceae bacterium]